MKNLRHSPEKVYLLVSVCNEFSIALTFATYVLFLGDVGLTPLQVNIVNVAFYLGRFALEVPTGLIADHWGRKVSCVAAFGLYALGTLVYWRAGSFFWCIVAELVLAVGATCLSGAFSAWFKYEMVLEGKHAGDIQVITARKAGYCQIAVLIGAPLGGLAAWCTDSTATPWLLAGIGEGITVIAAVMYMHESRVRLHTDKTFREALCELYKTAHRGFRYVKASAPVRNLMLISGVVTIGLMAPNMQWAPTFKDEIGKGIGPGLLFTGIGIALWLGSKAVPRLLLRTRSELGSLTIALIGMGIGIAAVGFVGFPFTLIGFGLYEFAYGMYKPLKEATLTNAIDSEDHATIQSFEEMGSKLAGAFGLLATGILAEYVSREAAWIFGGIVCCIAAFIASRSK